MLIFISNTIFMTQDELNLMQCNTKMSLIFMCLLCVQSMIMAHHIEKCYLLKDSLIREIDSYAPIVQRIINETTQGSFKGATWQDLATFVDKFGPRFTGTQALEDSIDYVLNQSIDLGLDNVHGEAATVPHWVRYNS